MSEAQIHNSSFAPGFSTAAKVTTVSGRGVGMDVVRTNIEKIGGTIDLSRSAAPGHDVHHQDPADAGDRVGADRRGRRRTFRDAAARRGRTGARPQQRRAPHRAHQGRGGAAAARQAAAAGASQGTAADRRVRHRGGLCRGDASRQRYVRHRGRRRVPHRGDRGQADVVEAAAHRDVLGQYHSGRRLGDRDHRSERYRAGARLRGRRSNRSTRCRIAVARHDAAIEQSMSLLVFRAGSQQPKACRSRSSRGSKRSIAARSKSRTAGIWCSTAAS